MQITHCPQCGTSFKVSPQQLQMAKGWVRCGRCSRVFEARLHVKLFSSTPRQAPSPASAPVLTHERVRPRIAALKLKVEHEETTPTRSSSSWLLWALCAFLLMLVLCWQLVVQQRHWLVAQEPAFAPVLSSLCDCEISWSREPDAIMIESSSFFENPEGGYIVQLHLKNTQHYPVAMPALELSLTDIQGQVVLRRVFKAQEWADADHLLALRDISASLYFDLDEKVSKRITGFRALVFYP